ncbi:MAG: efflux RND transporter periplasmic adaptor subunit [Methylotenera sp.]|nr:efflux RND transporter periplasmic adaptor subunit [Methylotenera sp.]MDD4927297.1 efflux RND transporter periplasmic adaptor subunit [Methylotenera sp.]
MRHRKLTSAIVIGLLPLALIACSEKKPADPRTQIPLVKTGSVQAASDSSRSFTGTVAARVQSDLAFRVPGKVLERLVDTGQIVKRGQPLMRIDPIDLQLTAHGQHEAVMAAKAHADQTAEEEIRHRGLVEAGAISASTYDQIKAAADSAKAQLKAAEAQADVAKNASSYAVLIADADGVVLDTLAEPGQVVNAGQTVMRIAHSGKREAIVHLPETLRPSLGSIAQANLFGKDNMAVPAKLRQLSESADGVSRTFEARYVLDQALANAPLGATVTIQIKESGSSTKSSLEVPMGAIFDSGKGSGVWVLEGSPVHVTWRPVKILSLSDDAARVEGNLKVNDQIITLGAHLLHEGEKVKYATNDSRISALNNGEEK